MSGFDPYGGGRIPREARNYFDEQDITPEEEPGQRSHPYKTTRITPTTRPQDLNDLEGLENYNSRVYGSTPQYDSTSRRGDNTRRNNNSNNNSRRDHEPKYQDVIGSQHNYNRRLRREGGYQTDEEDDSNQRTFSNPKEAAIYEQEKIRYQENLEKLKQAYGSGNNRSKNSNNKARPPQRRKTNHDEDDNRSANAGSQFNNPNRRYKRSEQSLMDKEFEESLKDPSNNYSPFDDQGNLIPYQDLPVKSNKGTKSNKYSNKTLEDVITPNTFKPGTIGGKDVDLRAPQFALFARNKDLEKHLFDVDPANGPLFLPFNDKMKEFDGDFAAKDKVYKEALQDGYFDERHLEGQNNLSEWGINPPKDPSKDNFIGGGDEEDDKRPTSSKRKIFKYDGSEFEHDEKDIDALYAQLQHISSTPPPENGLMESLARGDTRAWDGFKVPKLADLGLNPADAGYTDEEIRQLFGEMQFIDGKVLRGEELTQEEEEFVLPFSEEDLIERMAKIEAKKEYKMTKMAELDRKLQRRRNRFVLGGLRRHIRKKRYNLYFGDNTPRYVRVLTDDKNELYEAFDPFHKNQTFDNNWHPSMSRVGDSEAMDHTNYYRRYTNSDIQPLAFVLSGEMDELIGMFFLCFALLFLL